MADARVSTVSFSSAANDPAEEAQKRKRLLRVGAVRPAASGANQEWALDFVHDAAESGRKFRALSVRDVYMRECLALEVDTSFASRRVTCELERIVAERGAPEAIRCDNGPEFTSRHFLAWGWSGRSSWCTSSRRAAEQRAGIFGAARVCSFARHFRVEKLGRQVNQVAYDLVPGVRVQLNLTVRASRPQSTIDKLLYQ